MKYLFAFLAFIALAFIALVVVSTNNPAPPKDGKRDVQYGDTLAANVATVGCDTEDNFNKWYRLAREGDPAAAAKAASRSCIAIKMGSAGRAIKTFGTNSICVRWQGEPDCLWSPREHLLFVHSDDKN